MIDGKEVFRKAVLGALRVTGASAAYSSRFAHAGAILMLHSVTKSYPSPAGCNEHLSIRPEFLDSLLERLLADGYRFVTLDEMADRLEAGKDNARVLTLTADDGYRDNLEEALPVLDRHGVPITIYVAPGQIDRRVCLWWNAIEDIICARDGFYLPTKQGSVRIDCSTPMRKKRAFQNLMGFMFEEVAEQEQDRYVRRLGESVGVAANVPGETMLMDWNQLRAISRHPLVTIGAHTVHHYNLARLSARDAQTELADARSLIELELGSSPRHLAYPYGSRSAAGPREAQLAAAAGYRTAVTTRHGMLTQAHAGHLFALPRISLNGRYQTQAYVTTLLTGVTTPLANRGRRHVAM